MYEEFLERRRNARQVTGWWLCLRMRQLVRASNPASEEKFCMNWLYRFVRRWDVTWRKTTKKKPKPIQERLPLIVRFHQSLVQLLQDPHGHRGDRPLDTKWGRFLPQYRWNFDEIPWAFIGGLSATWDIKVNVSCLRVYVVLLCRMLQQCM